MKESNSGGIWKKVKKMKIKKKKAHILNFRKKSLLGIIDILILNWIRKQPLCGQDINREVLTKFKIEIGPGTLYPILYSLKKRGLIEPRLYNKKKMYFLTKNGKEISTKVQGDYFKIQKLITSFF